MLHLLQGDTRLFNYADNLIVFYRQGPRLGAVRGLTWLRRAWPSFETLHQRLTLALLKCSPECHTLIRSCILSLQPSYIRLTSWVVTQLVCNLQCFAAIHGESGSCFATVWGYKAASVSTFKNIKLHSSLATCHRKESKGALWYSEV